MTHAKISILGAAILDETAGMRACDRANALGVSETFLNYLIRGDRRLTVRMAKRLAGVTSKSALQWLEIEWGELG